MMPGILRKRRWQGISHLIVRAVSNKLLKEVGRHPSLHHLLMKYMDLSLVEPSLIATAVTRMKQADLRSNKMTIQQVELLFSAISESSSLQSLEIGPMNNLSTVKPDVMANAVNRLERAEMRGTQLTSDQVTNILLQSITNTRLQFLDLRGNGAMRTIPKELVEKAKLVIRELYCQHLPVYHCTGGV